MQVFDLFDTKYAKTLAETIQKQPWQANTNENLSKTYDVHENLEKPKQDP